MTLTLTKDQKEYIQDGLISLKYEWMECDDYDKNERLSEIDELIELIKGTK